MNSQLAIALHILGFLASQEGAPMTSKRLADTYGTSDVVLRRVLAKLKRAGLVETQRGVGGGSMLARPSSEINLREAYEAVAEDHEILRRPPGGGAGVAPVLAQYVSELYDEAERALLAQLESVTVEEMDAELRLRICGPKRRRARAK